MRLKIKKLISGALSLKETFDTTQLISIINLNHKIENIYLIKTFVLILLNKYSFLPYFMNLIINIIASRFFQRRQSVITLQFSTNFQGIQCLVAELKILFYVAERGSGILTTSAFTVKCAIPLCYGCLQK